MSGTSSDPPRSVHPRVRGAHPAVFLADRAGVGPSPRARGSPSGPRRPPGTPRSIPACAGLTHRSRQRRARRPVHPRVRGAHLSSSLTPRAACGPSPRARGSRTRTTASCSSCRSIPACAGLTYPAARAASSTAVHPRVRGAHAYEIDTGRLVYGPSPRARGSLRPPQRAAAGGRSIPACAGLTTAPTRTDVPAAVHPRVRGAHPRQVRTGGAHHGPSPRARGSRRPAHRGVAHGRSIPACAGLTTGSIPGCPPPAVHPRVRGAHALCAHLTVVLPGPSPRARGSRAGGRLRSPGPRSIPACAGLTVVTVRCVRGAAVHPRVRGAHSPWPLTPHSMYGPSPRARGSRTTSRAHVCVCGPSPRARGSPNHFGISLLELRSIPACAGLTASRTARAGPWPVHPRVRGAHLWLFVWIPWWIGPSPRARGSHQGGPQPHQGARSIPACAGLTNARRSAPGSRTVHPRVRGAHQPFHKPIRRHFGPSPRARGSQFPNRSRMAISRSIPACAGLT